MEQDIWFIKQIETLKTLGFEPKIINEVLKNATLDRKASLVSKTVKVSLTDSIMFLSRSPALANSFTGIYSLIDLPDSVEYEVFARDWFDFVLYPKRKKVGVKSIDRSFTISSTHWVPQKELTEENANMLLELNSSGKAYKLLVKNAHIPFVETFKDKKIIGVETNNWLFEKDDLRLLIAYGSEIIDNSKKSLRE